MRVGDIISFIKPKKQRINVPRIAEIKVISPEKININFFDNFNMGIEIGSGLEIMKVFIFDNRPGRGGRPVGMLLSNETPKGIKFIASEKFPGVKLKARIKAVQKEFSHMSYDEDFFAISKNLEKIKFAVN